MAHTKTNIIQNFRATTSVIITIISVSLLGILPYSSSYAKQLPDLGSEARGVMTPKNEVILGKAWLAKMRSSGMVSYDPIINAYLNNLGQKLALYSGIRHYPINVFAVRDESFNAFAFFGGNVGIHDGLITNTNSESELAAVMAHEIAHISQEHMLRQIVKQRQLMPITMAEALAAIALGAPDLILPVLAGHGQQVINFTRENEQEADRLGIQILANAGFDPQSMPNLFQNMGQQTRYDERPPEYLLTHPLYETRVVDARHRADNFKYKQAPSSLNYYLVKARIQALASKNINEKLTWFEHQIAQQRYENADAYKYGYALTLALNHNNSTALKILTELAQRHENNLIIQLALADAEVATGASNAALQRMQHLLTLHPDNIALILHYTEQLLAQHQHATAKQWLVKLRVKYPDEPLVYYNLARTESALTNNAGMYEANAEWHVLHADYDGAINQLALALKAANGTQDKNRISERQQEIKALIVKQKKI